MAEKENIMKVYRQLDAYHRLLPYQAQLKLKEAALECSQLPEDSLDRAKIMRDAIQYVQRTYPQSFSTEKAL